MKGKKVFIVIQKPLPIFPRLMPKLNTPIRARKYPQKNKNMTFYLVSVRDPEEGRHPRAGVLGGGSDGAGQEEDMIRQKYAGPCGRDCPRREPGCGATCEAWLAYEAERNAGYDKRAEIIDISQMTDGGARNCRRAARGKRKIGGEM